MSAASGGKAERDRDGAVAADPDPPARKLALRYVGQGAALDDTPARDLYADELTGIDVKALVASGLYEKAGG
jgi:hypothetical protein